jgi:hypothetical protein
MTLTTAFAAVVVLAPVAAGLAQDANTLTSEDKARGWRLLFDGATMHGWEDPASSRPPGDAWLIEDGCLKSRARPRVRRDLFTTESFGDFELVFDWRVAAHANSGVKYRIQDRFWVEDRPADPKLKRFEDLTNYRMLHRLSVAPSPGQEYVVGFEYQVIDNSVFKPGQGLLQRAGSLYDMIAASRDASRPSGEWNHSRIAAKGTHVEHWLNGVKVVDTTLDSPDVRAGIETRWGPGTPVAKALANPKSQGPISLQNHNDEAWFRNIKIRVQ